MSTSNEFVVGLRKKKVYGSRYMYLIIYVGVIGKWVKHARP